MKIDIIKDEKRRKKCWNQLNLSQIAVGAYLYDKYVTEKAWNEINIKKAVLQKEKTG